MAAPTLLSLRLVPTDFLRQPKAEIRLLTGNPFHTKLEMGTLVRFLFEAILSLTSYFKETALSKERLHQYSQINPVMGQLELFKHLDKRVYLKQFLSILPRVKFNVTVAAISKY